MEKCYSQYTAYWSEKQSKSTIVSFVLLNHCVSSCPQILILINYQARTFFFALCCRLRHKQRATSCNNASLASGISDGSLSSAQSAAAMMGASNNPWIECFIKGEWIFEKRFFSTHLVYESRKSSLLRKLWSEARWNESYNDLELRQKESCISGQGQLLWKRSSQIDMNDMFWLEYDDYTWLDY